MHTCIHTIQRSKRAAESPNGISLGDANAHRGSLSLVRRSPLTTLSSSKQPQTDPTQKAPSFNIFIPHAHTKFDRGSQKASKRKFIVSFHHTSRGEMGGKYATSPAAKLRSPGLSRKFLSYSITFLVILLSGGQARGIPRSGNANFQVHGREKVDCFGRYMQIRGVGMNEWVGCVVWTFRVSLPVDYIFVYSMIYSVPAFHYPQLRHYMCSPSSLFFPFRSRFRVSRSRGPASVVSDYFHFLSRFDPEFRLPWGITENVMTRGMAVTG